MAQALLSNENPFFCLIDDCNYFKQHLQTKFKITKTGKGENTCIGPRWKLAVKRKFEDQENYKC